jgi:hypothetical protein
MYIMDLFCFYFKRWNPTTGKPVIDGQNHASTNSEIRRGQKGIWETPMIGHSMATC